MSLSEKMTACALAFFLAAAAFAQPGADVLVSPDCGFKFTLPDARTMFKAAQQEESSSFTDPPSRIIAAGKVYSYQVKPIYNARVECYLLTGDDDKPISPQNKLKFQENFIKRFLSGISSADVSRKEYIFQDNKGIEIRFKVPTAKIVTRLLIVKRRLFVFSLVYNGDLDDTQFVKSLDSFALLSRDELVKAKIDKATPKPLPQTPVAAKTRTDAQDENLKGKVKSVIEDAQEPARARERYAENYYDETGNLVKHVEYEQGYPFGVSVWGYIDNQRVLDYGEIQFDEDQRPPRDEGSFLIESPPDIPAAVKKDARYSSRFVYKYDEKGRLIEKITYGNDGYLWFRTVFNYKGDQREEINYGREGTEMSRSFNILDKTGNVVEEYSLNEKGVRDDIRINTYTFDPQGNWIVKKTFTKKTVKGKSVLKPLWTSYRTITYYPRIDLHFPALGII